ncbi:carbon storage regulator CsrA [Piscirickettsia litoralis]|uniref:Translational regulator CsrA n=1 Tax=Piscirickettsia litoralis TaxID=1891921 RepID=A0ABX2ZXP9_9GAMM|nr:carbon storage regulator CsrA [Piscirickettsia litoralis]ODN40980.1 carbon storage regulator [Piscirickettsia litoralis]ODN41191.1 carbon storage regulator [Piscirickettsia litoralis]
MLVLTRKEDQAIFIGKDITVKVLSVLGNQVRIGIDAPQEVQIHRDDIKNKRPKPIKVAV